MDQKSYARIEKLRHRRARLKEKKAYALSRLRKYPAEIQRAVIRRIWLELMETERQIDAVTLAGANSYITIAANGIISRSLPIGARPEPEHNPELDGPDAFGFWRADNSSLIAAFGALRADIALYIDDIELPGLFIGPFGYEDADGNAIKYMILLDEAGISDDGHIRMMPDIIMDARRLSLRRDIEHAGGLAERRYAENRAELESAFRMIINARGDIGEAGRMLQDPAGAYLNYRRAYAEYIAEKYDKRIGGKDARLIKRLRKKFGLELKGEFDCI